MLRLAPETDISLFFVPDDYATGREAIVARRLFPRARIVPPADYVRFALGGGLRDAPEAVDVVQYLGGDLLHAARVRARLGGTLRSYKFARRRGARTLERAYAVDAKNVAELARTGVAPERIETVGNLAIDGALGEAAGAYPLSAEDAHLEPGGIIIMPGTRPGEIDNMAPFFLRTALRLRERRPELSVAFAISPFTMENELARILNAGGHRNVWGARGRIVARGTGIAIVADDGGPPIPVAQHPGDAPGLKILAFAELSLNRADRVEDVLAPLMASGHPDADTLDLMARARAMRGDMKGAEQELSRASALAPNNDDILNRLGAARVELGQIDLGEADLRRSLAQSPDQPRAAAALVQTALASGDIKGAQDAVDRLRSATGATEQVGVLDGQVKIAALDLTGAEAVYLDTLKRFPESRQATLGLVQVEGRLGNTKTARERLTGWMTAHPTDKVGLKMLVTGDMAGRDVAGAIAAVEAAHGAAPGDIDVDVALATLYLAAKTPDKAVDLIDRSTEAGSETNPALLPMKGQALIDLGRLSAAEAVLTHAIDVTPNDARPRFGLIEIKMRAKDYDAARKIAADGLEALPGNVRMQEALVAIDLKAHGIKAALQTAESLKSDPRNMPAALMLPGTALAASGDAPGAARAFLEAFHAAPSEQNVLIAAAALARAGQEGQGQDLLRAWTAKHPDAVGAQRVLAAAAITGHRNDEAMARLARVLAAAPSDSAALNNMAWVKLQTGDAAGAQSLAQRAYYLAPGAETQDTLGWILATRGDAARALPLLQQAAAMKPSQQILYHYAVVLADQSRAREAREVLDKALGDKKAFDERADAEKLRTKLGA